MILQRLLTALFDRQRGVRDDVELPAGRTSTRTGCTATLLPAIELLERLLEVVDVDGGVDYRQRALQPVGGLPHAARRRGGRGVGRAFERLEAARTTIRCSPSSTALTARRRAGGVVWFDFATLCGGPRSQNDYLELASASRCCSSRTCRVCRPPGPTARRFTWLVDVLYDRRVKLLVSAAAPPDGLYVAGVNSKEFLRTASRLTEMQTRAYMSAAHVSGDEPATT